MTFKRKTDIYLKNYNFNKPLIILGARQIGKTTTVLKYAKQQENYCYINLQSEQELKQTLETSNIDPKTIINIISIYKQKTITTDTLLIFDEIQESNSLLNSLKYFNESKENYKIIATGSLLGVTQTNIKTTPVGMAQIYKMYPLTFDEFLENINPQLHTYLQEYLKNLNKPNILHNNLLEHYDLYLQIGGFPEALKIYLTNNNILEVTNYLKQLNTFYTHDMSKYLNPIQSMITQNVYNCIETQLAKDNQKFMKKHIQGLKASQDYNIGINWLINAGLIYKQTNLKAVNYPLTFSENLNSYKIFILDTALLVARSNFNFLSIQNNQKIYTGILSENFICHELAKQEMNLNYYDNNSREIDFIIQHNELIIPIEVKSAYNTKAKSLTNYIKSEKPKLAIIFSKKELNITTDKKYLPLYLVPYLKQLLETKQLTKK